MTIWQCLISSRIFSASQRTTTSMQPHRQRQGLRSSQWRESHWPDSCGIRKLGANRVLPLCGFGQPARKDVENDQLGWRLPRTRYLQFTKCDTLQCRWGVIHETVRHSTGCACRTGRRSPGVFGAGTTGLCSELGEVLETHRLRYRDIEPEKPDCCPKKAEFPNNS